MFITVVVATLVFDQNISNASRFTVLLGVIVYDLKYYCFMSI